MNFSVNEDKNLKSKNGVDIRSSSNGKVHELKKEFNTLFDNSDKSNKKVKFEEKNPLNKIRTKNISIFDYQDVGKNKSNKSILKKDNMGDRIKNLAFHIEKDSQPINKNKSLCDINFNKEKEKDIPKYNKHATIDFNSNNNETNMGKKQKMLSFDSVLVPSTNKNMNSKLNNYLTLNSPKEINLFSDNKVGKTNTTKNHQNSNFNTLNYDSKISNTNLHNSSSNFNFKIDEVKNLVRKLKYINERDLAKMDSS